LASDYYYLWKKLLNKIELKMENSDQGGSQNSFRDLRGIPFFDFFEKNIRWMRWVIILVIYPIAFGFGFLTTKINPIFVVAGAILLLFSLLALSFYSKKENIPVIILVVALFIPFTVPTGAGSNLALSMVMVVLFFGLWLLHSMTVDKRISLKRINLPILSFMAVTLFSVFWSILFRDPFVYVWEKFTLAQIVASLVIVFLPVALLMMGNFIESTRPLVILSVLMIVAGVIGLIKNFSGLELPVDTRGLFDLWVTGLAIGFAFFVKKLHWSIKVFLLGLAAGWIYWSFFINISWVAGWLPSLVAIGILTLRRSWKLAFVFGIFAIGLIATNRDYYFGKVFESEKNESGYTRVEAWKMNWTITRDHLLFGTGPAGYAVYYMTYFPTDAMATHNNYIDILAQTGVVGAIFCLWFFVSLSWMGYKLCLRLKGRGDFVEALANISFAGTIACIIIMAFGDWMFPFAYTQTIEGFNYAVYNWLFMGAILVLDRLYPSKMVSQNG
jgi:hypothetical protein